MKEKKEKKRPSNLRLLTPRELTELKAAFEYDIDDRYLYIKSKRFDFKTARHPVDKPYYHTTRIRRLTYSPQAMRLWRELRQKDGNESVHFLDVLQAVNFLTITCQNITVEEVKKII